MSWDGIAAQLTFTKGLSDRRLAWWMALAISSLPTPVSPLNQNGAVGLSDLLNFGKNIQKRVALSHNLTETLNCPDLILEIDVFLL